MSDSALLNIEVKADGVDKAKKSLADLVEQGKKTEQSVKNLGNIYDRQGRVITESSIRQTKAFEDNARALKGVASSAGIADSAMGNLKGTLVAYASIGSLTGIAGLSDKFKLLNAQLKNSTSSQIDFNNAFSDVSKIATSAQVDIADLSKVYARLSNALKEFGTSQGDISTLTETLTLALKVNGATTDETTSALIQLSQAFGKGKLDGDEFKTVMEAAPNVMRELAKSLNVPFGALKDLAAQGGLTSDVLLKAFTNQEFLSGIKKQAEGMRTLSGSVVTTKNEFLLLVGAMDKITGSSSVVGSIFDGINTKISSIKNTIENGTWYQKLFFLLGNASGLNGLISDANNLRDGNTSTQKTGTIKTVNEVNANGQAESLKALQGIYNGLTDKIKLNSVALKEQQAIQYDAKKLLDGNVISASDYDSIIKKTNDSIKSLNGENNKSKELSKELNAQKEYELSIAKGTAEVNADLLKSAEALNAKDETSIEQLQRKIDGYSGASAAVRSFVQEQIDLATDNSLLKLLDDQNNAILNQVESIHTQAIELEQQNASYGKLPSVITDVTIARLKDKQAMLGIGLVVPEIEAQIQAYQRLKAAQFGKEDLDRNKKAEDDRVTAAKKSADDIAKAFEKASDDINKSLTDALLRGFESGKSFAKNFRDTLINMFKTMVLRPIVSFLVDSSGINKAIAAVTGSLGATGTANASSSGLGSLVQGGKSIFDLIGNGNASIVGGIESIGASIANGLGGIRDSIGGFIGSNSAAIADGFGYAGALIALSQGKIATSIGAGIGTFFGGPIGGTIGSVLGGFVDKLFGGGDKSPRLVTRVSSSYSNGAFNAGSGVNSFDGSNGTASNQASLQEAFAKSLGMLLKGFGLSDAVTTSSMLYKKRGTGAGFDASFDGGSVKTIEWSKSGDLNAIFQRMVDTVLGKTIVEAIQKTKLSDGIKALFNGLTDKTQVSNMLTASLNLNSAQEQLAKRFGLTVDQAAKVSVATGLAGDSLSTFANTLASSAGAFNTVGDVLVKAKAQLKANLGFEVPDSLNAFDLALKNIDKTTQAGIESFVEMFSLRDSFAAFTQTLDNLKGGVKGALYSIVSDTEKQAMLNADLAKAFGDLGLSVPTSIKDLITLGKSIDFTSKEGLDLASVFPSLVTAFNQTQPAVDGLMNSLRDINEFTTLVDFKRYKGLATNYGNSFANNYVDGMSSNVAASNSVNTPVTTSIVQPSNNTTISTSDPNLLEAIKTLTAQVLALQASADKTATHSKRAADVLVNVSPDGNILQTKVTV